MLHSVFGRPFIRALAVLGLALLPLVPVSLAQAQVFVPNEALVSSRIDLFDPEYNQRRAKLTWVDSSGRLWVAAVDRKTGLFMPSSGKGVLVDPDALTSADLKMVGNGPEWLPSSTGDRIVYTKFVAGLPHTQANARLAMAQQDPSTGRWSTKFLSDQPRYRPYASDDPNDPSPRISYIDPSGNAYWRDVDIPTSETIVPWMAAPRTLAMRFVQGQRAAVFVSDVFGPSEVVRYWLDTGAVERLTFDGWAEKTSSPFIWNAPELGGEQVLVVTGNASTQVRIYRHVDKTQPAWSVIDSVQAPIAGTRLSSVEPFVFDGKSYVFMSGVVPPNDFASTIYLSNIDAANPMFRQLTPDLPLRTRTDPEVFITNTGPFIYFYRADRSVGGGCPCYEGIFNTDTGLRTQ